MEGFKFVYDQNCPQIDCKGILNHLRVLSVGGWYVGASCNQCCKLVRIRPYHQTKSITDMPSSLMKKRIRNEILLPDYPKQHEIFLSDDPKQFEIHISTNHSEDHFEREEIVKPKCQKCKRLFKNDNARNGHLRWCGKRKRRKR